ncbi:MAG: hypothetical protein H7293_19115 [Candidatus Saccharibacteria bacterium]|nr:hypothetical protein [Rhodoferax sp.]
MYCPTSSAQILATGTDVRERFGARDSPGPHAIGGGKRQHALQRNVGWGDTYSFDVIPGMFDAIEAIFEENTHAQ